MQSHIDYKGLRAITSNTSDLHATSLQDTLGAGKAIPFTTWELDLCRYRVYRPTLGVLGGAFFIDDMGNTVEATKDARAKIAHFLGQDPEALRRKKVTFSI